MRKRSGQVHSRESSATLQLTVSLLYQVLHKSLSQKSGICYTVTEVLSDGRKDFEIGRET